MASYCFAEEVHCVNTVTERACAGSGGCIVYEARLDTNLEGSYLFILKANFARAEQEEQTRLLKGISLLVNLGIQSTVVSNQVSDQVCLPFFGRGEFCCR